jgi:hypothetical protein
MKIMKKIKDRLIGLLGKNNFASKDETELLALGSLLSKQQFQMNSTNLNDYEFKIFSQWGDDGIIQYLIKTIAIENQTFIEFGVGNYRESNTRFLMMNSNWEGFVMDVSVENMKKLKKQKWYWKYSLTNKAVFIDKENINKLLEETGFSNLGLLHIDIDGNDAHILDTLDLQILNPSIIIIEYNAVFGKDRPITVPYDKQFFRTSNHYSNLYFGASLMALTFIANNKGYALIGCNLAGNNAYYVRRDLLTENMREVSVSEGFKTSRFRESRSKDFTLSYLKGNERYNAIKGLKVLNVQTNELEEL